MRQIGRVGFCSRWAISSDFQPLVKGLLEMEIQYQPQLIQLLIGTLAVLFCR
jgi:hypothetical protein